MQELDTIICILDIRLHTHTHNSILFISFYHKDRVTICPSPQQHMPVPVGLYNLTHLVNIPCGMKLGYMDEPHNVWQSIDLYPFHIGSSLIEKIQLIHYNNLQYIIIPL